MNIFQRASALFRKADETDSHSVPVPTRADRRRSTGSFQEDTPLAVGKKAHLRSRNLLQKRRQVVRQYLRQGSYLRRTLAFDSESTSDASSEASTDDDMDLSMNSCPDVISSSVAMGRPNVAAVGTPVRRTGKTIQWDAFVDQDLHRRALARHQREELPEWKKRQIAHRVHRCNERRAAWHQLQREFRKCKAEQEIEVAPACEYWVGRDDLDILEEFAQLDIDLFGAGNGSRKDKKNKPAILASF